MLSHGKDDYAITARDERILEIRQHDVEMRRLILSGMRAGFLVGRNGGDLNEFEKATNAEWDKLLSERIADVP